MESLINRLRNRQPNPSFHNNANYVEVDPFNSKVQNKEEYSRTPLLIEETVIEGF